MPAAPTTPPPGPVQLLMDVDTGIDDSLALLYVLARPDVDLVGIVSTAGNVPRAQVAANNLAWLDLGQAPAVEVALGAPGPLVAPLMTTEDTHGPQGIGYAVLPPSARPRSGRSGAELWAAAARAHPGELVGLVTGPLTNLALALRIEPELPWLLRRLVIMGGAFNHPGNTTPVSEWNVAVDPEAAHEVFTAFGIDGGVRPVVCPLDLTERIAMTPDHLAELATVAGPSALLDAVADAVRYYFEFHRDHAQGYLAHLHDPYAATVALDPAWATTRSATVEVELVGTVTRGMTVADWTGMWARPENAEIAVDTDPDAWFAHLIATIGGWARGLASAAR
ncbi:MAG: nucleoside hydrolase [Propionibacteriaceae bacterium]